MNKKIILFFLISLIMVRCSSDKSEDTVSYEEKAANAIKEFTNAKEVKSVEKMEEMTKEDAEKELSTLKESAGLFEGAIIQYKTAIESYESAKESMSKIDKSYSEMLGLNTTTNYDSLIQDMNTKVSDVELQLNRTESLINSLESALSKSDGKSPYTKFKADVEGKSRIFAVSPDGKEVVIYFEETIGN